MSYVQNSVDNGINQAIIECSGIGTIFFGRYLERARMLFLDVNSLLKILPSLLRFTQVCNPYNVRRGERKDYATKLLTSEEYVVRNWSEELCAVIVRTGSSFTSDRTTTVLTVFYCHIY